MQLRILRHVRSYSFRPLYASEATTVGGRNGRVKSADGVLDLELVTPPGLGGPGGLKANPETLFAAAYSACFSGAVHLHASHSNLKLPAETSVTAQVQIGKDESGVELQAHITVKAPGVNNAELQRVVKKAHETCPYSAAIRGNVPVTFTVVSTKF